jgi:carbon starvation protein CstA
MENPDGFNIIWQYFGWSNQALSVFTLWTITVYLCRNNKNYLVSLIPALFMTTVCSTFIFVSPQALELGTTGYLLGAVVLLVACVWFSLSHPSPKGKG